MERKYIMQLPRGAKVSSTDIKYEDGKIVLTAQLEEWKPEDGEVCYIRDIKGYESVFIKRDDGCNITSCYVSFDNHKTLFFNPDFNLGFVVVDVLRPATEAEKQQLFDALAEQNKRWNAEKKVVEDVRWRAMSGGNYYHLFFGNGDYGISETVDIKTRSDNSRYLSGNYFKTEEAARIAGNQILELLKKSKAE